MIRTIVNGWKYTYIEYRRRKMNEEAMLNKVKEMYEARSGQKLDINHPKTYSEKIQAFKISDAALDYSKYADKYAVREWVGQRIGDQYLIPIIGAWKDVRDIPFKELPNQFIFKANHSSGQNYIVKDKKTENILRLKLLLRNWLKTDYSLWGFERQYEPITPMVIAEELIVPAGVELLDYRFLSFDGEVKLIIMERKVDGVMHIDLYDKNWQKLPATYGDYPPLEEPLTRPDNLNQMLHLAEKLSKGFPQVRVDLYNVEEQIYFGEMTFTPISGNVPFHPDSLNLALGNAWDLNQPLNVK